VKIEVDESNFKLMKLNIKFVAKNMHVWSWWSFWPCLCIYENCEFFRL